MPTALGTVPRRLARAGATAIGLDGLLDVIEQLQGVPLVGVGARDARCCPRASQNYAPAMLDTLLGAAK